MRRLDKVTESRLREEMKTLEFQMQSDYVAAQRWWEIRRQLDRLADLRGEQGSERRDESEEEME